MVYIVTLFLKKTQFHSFFEGNRFSLSGIVSTIFTCGWAFIFKRNCLNIWLIFKITTCLF